MMDKEMVRAERPEFKARRSRILYQVTALVIAVLIISGLVTFFLVRNSQEKLIEESIDKVITTEVENLSNTFDYLISTMVVAQSETLNVQDVMAFSADILAGKITDVQRYAIDQYKTMVDSGFFGTEYIILILPSSGVITEPFIMASNDESLIYNWELPDNIAQAMDEGESYLLLEEGIPELDLEGAQLVIFTHTPSPFLPDYDVVNISIIPMQEKIDSINAFYDSERNSISLTLGLVVLVSIIVVALITFFLLNYLIHKRITEPVDELAAAAEQVMQGNLDVEITVHEGGDFEGLERAFREMVESFRKYIARSTGEE
jgi:HAMP domain-containing protein